MKSTVRLLQIALLSLGLGAALAPAETMTERELRRLVERERSVLGSAATADGRIDDSAIQTRLQEIVRDYESLLKKDPQFVPTYVAYGLFLSRGGEPRRAAELFRKADQLDPNLAVVKNQLGNVATEAAQYDQALPYYEAAIRLEPAQPLYHFQLGNLLYEFRDQFIRANLFTRDALFRRSTEAFARAAELAPTNFAYAYRHAESLYDLPAPDWPAALAVWKALEPRVKPGVELQTLRLHQANVLINLGRADEARTALEAVTEAVLQENKKKLVALLPPAAEKSGR